MNYYVFALFLFIVACQDKTVEPVPMDETKSYLHIAHTRTGSNPKMDSTAESIDYDQFDMLWLGGDLAYLTSEDDATMSHIDTIYDLASPNTLWALGNHDYSDLDRVTKYTGRPPYYSHHKNGITFIVLDTQDSLSNLVSEQKELLLNVIDTIQESSHLILLHHKLIWMYNNGELDSMISETSNGQYGNCFFCLNPNNFMDEIYPELVKAKERGIEVICVAGDIGFKTNEFEHVTDEGIYFLASGIDYYKSDNQVLIFDHDPVEQLLDWHFIAIDSI